MQVVLYVLYVFFFFGGGVFFNVLYMFIFLGGNKTVLHSCFGRFAGGLEHVLGCFVLAWL